jgi:hypothetical protein
MGNDKLSFDEFLKLPDKEKGDAYKRLSDKDKFRARLSQPLSGTTIDHIKYTDKERKKNKEEFLKFLKSKGINE